MADLISRSALEAWVRLNYSPHQSIAVIDLEQKLKTMPTAYDVEAVVAELEKEYDLADKEKARCMRENLLQYDEAKGYARGIDTAISIVRGKE